MPTTVVSVAHLEAFAFRDHEAILQTLDRESNGIYLAREAFESNLGDWEGVPVVFAQDHPDPDAFAENPEMALEKVKGRMVGTVRNPSIDMTGHPRLMAQLAIDDDDIDRLIDEGAANEAPVSLSTAFRCPAEEDGDRITLTGPVDPNHVLLFVEEGDSQPGDKGAFILNRQNDEHEAQNLLRRLGTLITNLTKRKVTTMSNDDEHTHEEEDEEEEEEVSEEEGSPEEEDEEEVEEIDEGEDRRPDSKSTPQEEDKDKPGTVAALSAALEEANGAITALRAENAQLRAAQAQFEHLEKDQKWLEMKAHLPKGMVHGDNEAESRKEFEANPAGFALKVLRFKDETEAPGGREGAEHINAPTGDPKPDLTVGAYDPDKGWGE